MITAVVLSPSLDIAYDVDELAIGAIHRPRSVSRCAGGKGLNMARAAATLGADVHALAVLGGPVGDLMETLVAEAGLPVTVVANAHETRICVSVSGAEMTELYQHATPLAEGVLDQVGVALDGVLAAGDLAAGGERGWVVVNGGLPAGADPARVAAMLGRARAQGARLAADCYGDLLERLLEVGVDLVKINRSEACGLTGLASDVALTELVAAVAERAGVATVVTDGAHGSMVQIDGQRWLVAASTERGRYSQGSGDSYLGGLLAGLAQGLSWPEAVRLGAGTATANALVPGPGVLRAEDARRIAAALDVRPA